MPLSDILPVKKKTYHKKKETNHKLENGLGQKLIAESKELNYQQEIQKLKKTIGQKNSVLKHHQRSYDILWERKKKIIKNLEERNTELEKKIEELKVSKRERERERAKLSLPRKIYKSEQFRQYHLTFLRKTKINLLCRIMMNWIVLLYQLKKNHHWPEKKMNF